jgi:hypothetical protein
MRWVWLLPSPVLVVTAVRSRAASAPPEPTGSGGTLEHAVDTDYAIRTAQVTGL